MKCTVLWCITEDLPVHILSTVVKFYFFGSWVCGRNDLLNFQIRHASGGWRALTAGRAVEVYLHI